jgi:hypothetical protein
MIAGTFNAEFVEKQFLPLILKEKENEKIHV